MAGQITDKNFQTKSKAYQELEKLYHGWKKTSLENIDLAMQFLNEMHDPIEKLLDNN